MTLARSRVGSMPDLARLGAALARPGMDPRIWCSLAYVTKYHLDPVHGPLADIVLMPSGAPETARVGAIYAGKGWGIYSPVHEDDQVVVVAPSGEPDEGLVITMRLWTQADSPPQTAIDHPDDLILHAEPGVNVRIAVTGGGEINLASNGGEINLASGGGQMNLGGGQINLGAEDADTGVVRFSDLKAWADQLVIKFDLHGHSVIGIPTTPAAGGSPSVIMAQDPGLLPGSAGSDTAKVAP